MGGVTNEFIYLIVTTLLGGVIWLVRLEGRVNQNEKRIESQDKRLGELLVKIENIDNKIVDELAQLNRSVARIEGKLSIKKTGDD